MVSLNDLQTPSKVSKLKVADLKEELEKYGLSQDGLKSELVERLKQHLQSSDSEKPDGEPNTEEIEMQDKDENNTRKSKKMKKPIKTMNTNMVLLRKTQTNQALQTMLGWRKLKKSSIKPELKNQST